MQSGPASIWSTLYGSLTVASDLVSVSARRSRPHDARPGRHVALLAWALPPSTIAGVHRPLSFLRHGTELGWRFSTFQGETPSNQSQHGEELLARVPPGVHRTIVPDDRRPVSWRLFPHLDGGFVDAVAFAREAMNVLHDDPPDVVLASGPPFHTFVAARWVARHFGVPYVLDYRDEWSECPFDFVQAGPDDRRYEQACLASAAAVLFTTESHRRHQLKTFSELTPERAHLVPNGWEPEDFEPVMRPSPHLSGGEDAPLRLAHVGMLGGHASPLALLQALQTLEAKEPGWPGQLHIELVGRRSRQAEAELQQVACATRIVRVDHVSKREAVARMQAADALLLLASPELERYLPSKLFDYVAAGRPVLVYGSRGEASELLEGLGLGVFCPAGDPDALGQALTQLRTLRHLPPPPAVQPWLQAHRRSVLAARAFRIIDAVHPAVRAA